MEESDTDAGSFEEEDGGVRRNPTRAKRLPFSPKKARSFPRKASNKQRILESDSSASASSSMDESEEAIDSTRTKGRTEKRQAHKKRQSFASVLRNDYGIINKVVDVLQSEMEMAFLTAHRPICVKCRQEPAHLRMSKFRKRPNRRRIANDEDHESVEDEQSILDMGGWVRW